MANILLDYAIPFSQVTTLPPPNYGHLHKLAVVVQHDVPGTTADATLVSDPAELPALTAFAPELEGAFDGGLPSITLIRVDDVAADLPALIDGKENEFFTLFGHQSVVLADFLAASEGWLGVRGSVSNDPADVDIPKQARVCLFGNLGPTISSYNPLLAFGSLLSGARWRNQQYMSTTETTGLITTKGICEALFDERVSFWLQDDDNGNRLGFFGAGGESITTPYINEEVQLNVQYQMANYVTVNQPFNVAVSRASLARLGNKLVGEYIDIGYLDPDAQNIVTITDAAETFVVSGALVISPSVALWRVRMDAYQTQG